MYGRSSINSVSSGSTVGSMGGDEKSGGDRTHGGSSSSSRAQSLASRSSIGGGNSSSVETGPRSSRDVRQSIPSNCRSSVDNNNHRVCGGGGRSNSDSPYTPSAQSPAAFSEEYDQTVLKARASVLSQLSSVFGQKQLNRSISSEKKPEKAVWTSGGELLEVALDRNS